MCLFVGFSLIACQKAVENEAEKALVENETAIQNYIKTKNLTMQKTASGLYYQKQKENASGKGFKTGDELTIHYTLFTLQGVVVDSTDRLKNQPYAFSFGGIRLLAGMEEALLLMKTGERSLLLLNHTLAFQNQSNALLPAYSPLGVVVELVRARTEAQQIDDYVANKKLTVTEKTSSGLYFIRTAPSTEDVLKSGQNIQVKYTGKLLNDKVFDSGQFAFMVGAGRTIKGFEEGIAKMRLGEKAKLIFASDLGYGTTGSGSTITPYAPLLFEIEVVK